MRVSLEIFSPVDVCEDRFIQFEEVLDKGIVEA